MFYEEATSGRSASHHCQVKAALALAVNATKPALGGDLHFDPFRLSDTAGLYDAAWLNGATTSVCVLT
jgi:hypothetical protein